MKKNVIFWVLAHFFALACMGQSSNERILKELDGVIAKKKEYSAERERTIAQLKQIALCLHAVKARILGHYANSFNHEDVFGLHRGAPDNVTAVLVQL